ncbi:glycosyltransferase [candidate division GN15 bacterium]|nr:glycosyltransferase [candidate division GN15 bacterium]
MNRTMHAFGLETNRILVDMKVLIFNSLYTPHLVGGAERSVQLLAETLVSRGHRVSVASTGPSYGQDRINGVDVYYLKTPNLYWMRDSARQPVLVKPIWHAIDTDNRLAEPHYRRLIERLRPDIVHTNNLAGLSVAVWRAADRTDIPVVHTIRDHYLLCARSTMFRRGCRCTSQCTDCRIFSLGKKQQASRVTAAVGISTYILEKHLRYGFFTNTAISRTIHNPILPVENRGTKRDATDQINIGFVGRLAPHKGVELLLSSVRRIDSPRFRIHLYGEGQSHEYERLLKDRYTSSRVIFHGVRPPEEIYGSLDMLVVPSLCDEAFGRIVPEANAQGVPVITSNRGGLPEIVRDCDNGFIFDADRPESLTERLKQLLTDDRWRRTMPDRARRRAQDFSTDSITRQYEELYGEVVR